LKYAGIPVRAYTHVHAQLSHADLMLPPKLAGIVDIDHTQIRGGEYSAELEEIYDRHTAGHSVDRDRFYYSNDYFKWCRKGDIILRGHCFAIGRDNRGTFPVEQYGQDLLEAERIIEKYMQRGFKYTGRDPAGFFPAQLYQALSSWVAWSISRPEKEIDWRDRLTMEQRHAGWLSSIEQSLDLIDADRFHPGNSHYFYALVLQIPEQIRLSKQSSQQHELIRRMAPELLELPFNPPDPISLHDRIVDRLKLLARIAVGKRT